MPTSLLKNGITKEAVLLVAASLMFATPLVTSAGTGLTLQPIKISVTLNPGDDTAGTIHLANASDGPVDVQITKQDFLPEAGYEGIRFVGRTPGVTSVIDWITIDKGQSSISLAQGEARDVPYTIVAPANAEPGGHFGVMLFNALPQNGGGTLKIGTQVGMLVLVAVPGNHLEKGQILDFTAPKFVQQGPVSFSIKFQNTGTVHFEPRGAIKIQNMFGQEIAQVPIEGQVVLPTSVRTLGESWNVSGLLLGRYSATAEVKDGEGTMLTTDTITFWAFPVWYGIAFFVTVVLLFLVIRFLKSRVQISIVKK